MQQNIQYGNGTIEITDNYRAKQTDLGRLLMILVILFSVYEY